MKLICIRHTKTAMPAGTCYGQSDVPLADSYLEEKQLIEKQLTPHRFCKVYCSPLNRCSLLARQLFPRENVVSDGRLMELNFGEWELQHWDEISKTPHAKVWFEDFVYTQCPQGESFSEQILRTQKFLEELRQKNFKQVAIITHGGTIRAIHSLLNKIPPHEAFNLKVDYGEVLSFEM